MGRVTRVNRRNVLFSLLLVTILTTLTAPAAAGDSDCAGGSSVCRLQDIGTLSMEKNSQVNMGNYVFRADDYDGKGSVAISYYNTSSPKIINRTIVTGGEYTEDGDLRFYGKQITNTNNILNRSDAFGLWPCCPRAVINVWQKVWIPPTPRVTGAIPLVITFSISGSTNGNAFLIGQPIPYTISIRAGNKNIKNLRIVLNTTGLQLLTGEQEIDHAGLYSSESYSHDGVLMAPIIGQLSPGIEWSYRDADNNTIEGTASASITILPPIKVSKYYSNMVCTGRSTWFSIGITNLHTMPVSVNLTDALPDGFYSGNNSFKFKKNYQLELGPSEVKTIEYAAEPKTIGLIDVPKARASWKMNDFHGTVDVADTNGGTIKVYGPLIVVSKNAVVKNNLSGNDETISVGVNIFNAGDTIAYIEIADILPLNLSKTNISGAPAYKGYIEPGGKRNITYEFYHNEVEVNLSDITNTAPKIEIYASKLDSRDHDTEHAYASAYIFKNRMKTELVQEIGTAETSRNAERNPSIVFQDVYTKQTDADNNRTAPESQPQLQSSVSFFKKVRLFLRRLADRI